MPPLVGGQVHPLAVLIADVAGVQPAVLGDPVGAGGDGPGAVDVGLGAGEQDWGAVWPALADPVVLPADEGLEFLVGFSATATAQEITYLLKRLDAVVVNDISKPGIGFDTPENEVTLVTAAGDSPVVRSLAGLTRKKLLPA